MPEEKINALEKEEQTPKTLEELFIVEHLEAKNELKNTQDELASAKRALTQVSKELKFLKSIITKHATPIEIADDGHIVGGSINIYIYTNAWDPAQKAEVQAELDYLKPLIPIEEKADPVEESEEATDGKED